MNTNDDEVFIPCLSSILLAVTHTFSHGNSRQLEQQNTVSYLGVILNRLINNIVLRL